MAEAARVLSAEEAAEAATLVRGSHLPDVETAPGQPVVASGHATRDTSSVRIAAQPMLTDTGQLTMFG